MYEQTTIGFVLSNETVSEHDSLVSLYTKDLGKVLARVTSGSKLKSKLMPHLQVGNKASVRLVERKVMRVADALSLNGASGDLRQRLVCLDLLSKLSTELGSDSEIWSFLSKENWSTIKLLKILGLYGDKQRCLACSRGEADYFSILDSNFYCAACSTKASKNYFFKLF